ncbi:hypothetical protein LCGC14_1195830 [marine sediment metagenome]|uniref:Uncharacterized protein n=1 Tax=marine sediment metagenome TaxID=412755 RepID=A0A0F9PNB9_9ZZZZ
MKRTKFTEKRKRIVARPLPKPKKMRRTKFPEIYVVMIKGIHDKFYINPKFCQRGVPYKMTRIAAQCLVQEMNYTYCGTLFYYKIFE